MKEYRHRTDALNSCKVVTVGKQKRHWIEFQLLDERGEPLANMPFRAMNEATRTGCVPEFSGQSDEQGIIRIEDLHPLPITLLITVDPFAKELQGRRLRAERAEPLRPGVGDGTDLYGPQRSGFSPLEKQAREAGHHYHYLRIGQLCDGLPVLEPALPKDKDLPKYHFPDPEFKGFTLKHEQLDHRHVLEVCPFRAWSLLLHHQSEYSLVNAYNLGLMSILAYGSGGSETYGSPPEFFTHQCLDLSRTPRVLDGGEQWPCLVIDVPFNKRYTLSRLLDTTQVDVPEGDTQLFYAINNDQVLVAWRGTEMKWADLVTDLTFRPVDPHESGCGAFAPCHELATAGKVHLGFKESFDLMNDFFSHELKVDIGVDAGFKDFFVCGHSLGGALALIHAASLKDSKPLLYTYGMPRTFTLKAMSSLSDIKHFRHVNDMDVIPSIPPSSDLDNSLYEIYGVLGTTLGFGWSVAQLMASNVISHGDPFAHHGELAAFSRTDQHIQERGSQFPAYRSKEGLGAPYYTVVSRRLPEKTKLYLVPSLGEEDDKLAEGKQKEFMNSLSQESLRRYFPANENLKKGRVVTAFHHFMSQYQPYMHNQLLESINPERMQHRIDRRKKFSSQMQTYHARIHPAELARNQAFIELQNRIANTLFVTRRMDGGEDALKRFDSVADADAYVELL